VANLPHQELVSSGVGDSLQHALGNARLDIDLLPIAPVLQLLLGSVVNGIVTPVVGQVIAPLLGEIGRVLLDPLLSLLGVQVGSATLQLETLQLRGSRQLLM